MTETDDYVLGRNIFHSVRLDAQHLLWRIHTGYILHPQIPITDNMRVAELGTGTGIWLCEAAKELPSTTQLDGFDISSEQFPNERQCPPNLTFDLMDSYLDPPLSLVGQYDVVHLRMWASNMKNGDSGPILRHAMQLLKPGGFLQWEEADLTNQVILGEKARDFETGVNKLFRQAGLDYRIQAYNFDFMSISWVPNLHNQARDTGFIILESERKEFQHHLTNLCTNTYLLALQEILQGIRKSCPSEKPQSIMEHEIALHHLFSVERKNIVYNWGPTTLLGRKPSCPLGQNL
ncbi:hypothetical protein FE257_009306 [Aspergillus nanangensis]|uniref:Methyltransferase domain-containing protein n=1 Tax=Aspergillus nanangensis TaxID=2582783 RepID=A0AAD4GSV1_ASPNN|nr:hypothetical protein FE257_009306 [Aspergillus nanangensis]